MRVDGRLCSGGVGRRGGGGGIGSGLWVEGGGRGEWGDRVWGECWAVVVRDWGWCKWAFASRGWCCRLILGVMGQWWSSLS